MKKIYQLAVYCSQKSIFLFLLAFSLSSNAQESMSANLYSMESTGPVLMDGNLTEYNNTYSNKVDMYDAWKMTNPGINFGILRSTINLAVERRCTVANYDTTFFRMWNMLQKNYSIKFNLKNMDHHDGMHCYLTDNYLGTQTLVGLNDITDYAFTINADPASSSEMRFQLVYVPAPVDVDFTAITAHRNGTDIKVQWDIIHEQSITSYTVQHSFDNISFTDINIVTPYNTANTAKTYFYTDLGAPKKDHYYRIKALRIDGAIQYSNVAKINEGNTAQDISIYPNPVESKTAQLQFNNIPAGTYYPVLIYGNGMKQTLPSFTVSQTQSNGTISLPQNIVAGVYYLQFTGPGNVKILKTIRVL